MKTIRTRTLIAFLGAFFCWLVPNSSWASVEIDGIYYDLDISSNMATVSMVKDRVGDLFIPAIIDYNGNQYTVTGISDNAFQYCHFTSLYIPYSVTSILPTPNHWSHYDAIIVDENNPTFDSRDNCNAVIHTASNTLVWGSNITVIPNSVTAIGDEAFFHCGAPKEIPNSVTRIGWSAFGYNPSLTSIVIPESVTSIGGDAFWDTPWYDNQPDGLVYAGKVAYAYKGEMPEETTIVLKEGTLGIGDCLFNGWTWLSSVQIPNSMINIGEGAFEGCTGLTSIEIPNSVTSIGDGAFHGCTGLTSIEIPNSVTNIGRSAFSGCSGLASIDVDASNATYDSRENCNAIIETSTNTLICGCKNTVIPSSVTSIGSSAFESCTSLTSVTIPNSVTYIGSSAFEGCNGLTSIDIPNRVTSIGDQAFCDCTSLTSVEIPNSVTSIGVQAFGRCTGLTSVTIPNSVTSIGESAFFGCTSLTSVEIPNSVTSIGSSAFSGCTGLTTIKIPNSVTSISAFSGCTGLTSVEIPNSVTSIGWSAFYGCTGLTSITAYGENPAQLASSYNGIQVFKGVDKTNCILYVPVGSKSAYESAEGWSEFQNIVEFEPDTDISALDNAIYVEETEARIGGTMDIPVMLKNSYPVRGFQFKLELPEGATINSWALSSGRMPSGATESDKIATQKIDGNTIAIACSLNYGDATFTGNDGEIATVNVTFAEDMEEGRYPIYLTGCDVTTADGVDEDLSDIKATLVLEDYLPGDANGDGKVRIGDATAILNYIVGNVSNNFQMKAADTNGDGRIRIGDATAVLNLIVNQL